MPRVRQESEYDGREAYERFVALAKWFGDVTGLPIGPAPELAARFSLIISLAAAHEVRWSGEDYRVSGWYWAELDPALSEVLSSAEIQGAMTSPERKLMFSRTYEELKAVRDAHERLRQAARAALQTQAGTATSWRNVMPPAIVEAVVELVDLEAPYPEMAPKGRGSKPLASAIVAERRQTLAALDRLRLPDARPLTARQLTALFALVFPRRKDTSPMFWGPSKFDGDPEHAVLGSPAFLRLCETYVPKDRQRY